VDVVAVAFETFTFAWNQETHVAVDRPSERARLEQTALKRRTALIGTLLGRLLSIVMSEMALCLSAPSAASKNCAAPNAMLEQRRAAVDLSRAVSVVRNFQRSKYVISSRRSGFYGNDYTPVSGDARRPGRYGGLRAYRFELAC